MIIANADNVSRRATADRIPYFLQQIKPNLICVAKVKSRTNQFTTQKLEDLGSFRLLNSTMNSRQTSSSAREAKL